MTRHPLVSVVMPAFNVGPFVEAAAVSVLDQSWPEVELIVVDDGSTDDTGAILERLAAERSGAGRRMVIRRQENGGLAAALNRAIAEVGGPYVCFCDGDDRLRPELIERLVGRLEAEPDLDMVFPRYVYVDEAGAPFGVESAPPRPRYGLETFLIENPVECASGTVLRTAALERAAPFDESLPACVHLDFFLRVLAQRPRNAGGVDAFLVDYRRRPGQITGNWRRMQAAWQRMTEKRCGEAVLPPAALRRALADQCVFWSAIAYQSGEYGPSRRLIADAIRTAPAASLQRSDVWVRLAACATALLPRPLHKVIEKAFNKIRLTLLSYR